MSAVSRASAEPPIGELAIAQAIADSPSPISEFDDGMDGGSQNDANAVAHALIYRNLTDRSYHELHLHFERHPEIMDVLGVEHNLKQNSWSNAMQTQFSGYEPYFESFAEHIRERIHERYPSSLVEPHLASTGESEPVESLPTIPEDAIDEKVRHVRAIMLDETDFDRVESRTDYDDESILLPFLEAAQEFDAPANIINDNDHDFSIKTAFNAVKQRDAMGWHEEFKRVNERLLKAATRSGMLQGGLDGYIDLTIIPYWPQEGEPAEGHRQGEPKNGTTYGFHFATLVAHDPEFDKDVVVAVEPYTQDMKVYDLVENLFEQVEEHVTFDSLRLDSGFQDARVIQFCRERDINPTVRLKRRGDELKGALAAMEGRFDDYDDYPVTSSEYDITEKVRVVAEPDWNNASKDDFETVVSTQQRTFSDFSDGDGADVLDVDEVPNILWQARRPYGTFNTEDSPEEIIRRHKLRWRVETSYAQKKTKLMARTGSRHHGVRVFLFWLSTLLYNGWMLTRKFLREDFPNHRPQDRGAVQLTTFIKKILRLDYG